MLKLFSGAAVQVQTQLQLLQEIETLRSAAVSSRMLRDLSGELNGHLGDKLQELALIMEGYDAVTARANASTEDPLAILAKQIRSNGLHEITEVYVDGFLDFTGLETDVIKAMLEREIRLTVCLPGTPDNYEEHFLPSRIAAEQLKEIAEELERDVSEEYFVPQDAYTGSAVLRHFIDHMFDFGAEKMKGQGSELRVVRAANPREECEGVAAAILRAVREDGCRWRELAVAVRGFENYRQALETCFRRYEIPLFITRKDSLLDRPLSLCIDAAYRIVLGNWETEDVSAYLRCGLSGLTEEACDELCGYLYKWQIKKEDWLRKEPWRQHPEGYGRPMTEEIQEKLGRIHNARLHIAKPLLFFSSRVREANTATEQVQALADFFNEMHMERCLRERSEELLREEKLELAAEYEQFWETLENLFKQISGILGEAEMDAESFQKLLSTLLAQIDIGIIPVALDRVAAGDFDRMRRRNIRRLYVLGCSDDRLPPAHSENSIFTEDERTLLTEKNLRIGGGDLELWREYAIIYQTLSLPSEQLLLAFPLTDSHGEKLLPAFVYNQAKRMFDLADENISIKRARLSSREPALTLALSAHEPKAGKESMAAYTWFNNTEPEKLKALKNAAKQIRGSLSASTVDALYGKRMRISPSKLESFEDCRFRFYCEYGLKAEAEETAAFRPPEIGSFTHYVLEQVAVAIRERGGLQTVDDRELQTITGKIIQEYVETELGGFSEKSARFRYLFTRLSEDVRRIVQDMVEELRRSDFVPLSFELDISALGTEIPLENGSVQMTGIADRIDGWIHGDSIHLRVVDYKTGRKQFHLSDVCYGRNLQMLLYLFAVCDHSKQLYGKQGIPAGILYLPAREDMLSFNMRPDEKTLSEEKINAKRRSGLLLDDEELIEAWEKGEEKHFIPIRTRSASPLVTLEQIGKLRRQAEHCLSQMAIELQKGRIEANPAQTSERLACEVCAYQGICHFEEGMNGEYKRALPRLSDKEAWKRIQADQQDNHPSE